MTRLGVAPRNHTDSGYRLQVDLVTVLYRYGYTTT